MLKQGTFINKKYYSMLLFNLLSWSASSFLVIALFVWFIRSKYGKEGFPWYLERIMFEK